MHPILGWIPGAQRRGRCSSRERTQQALKIAYLLEGSELSGGVRVVLGQADALIKRGHDVTIFSKGPRPDWRQSLADWEIVRDFREATYDQCDFVIATFWTTVLPAFERAGARAIHLCQGLEFTFSAYAHFSADIRAAYSLPIPKLVISPHLIDPVSAFGEVTAVRQIIDNEFFCPPTTQKKSKLRVLLVGAMQIDFKGIDIGYAAVRTARNAGSDFDLVRVSPWDHAADEPVQEATEFFVSIDTSRMVTVMRSCDVFLGPSRREEGFGLPAAEAMAAGLPCVLTSIPSFEHFDKSRTDYALWATEGDGVALGRQLSRLLTDPFLQNRLVTAGREVAEHYREDNVGASLEAYLLSRREGAPT